MIAIYLTSSACAFFGPMLLVAIMTPIKINLHDWIKEIPRCLLIGLYPTILMAYFYWRKRS
jgi:hypothetical protein